MNPSEAFDELDKLIFCKVWDERKPRKKGEPYAFQVFAHDTDEKTNTDLLERVRALYEEGRKKDPEVFKDDIRLRASKVRAVVGYLQDINLSDTDLDSKGRAFETFMGSFFRGDFGQYFTPRPIVKFIVDVLPITHESKVLDTSCGSGGFLLHALDKVRCEADSFYPDEIAVPAEGRKEGARHHRHLRECRALPRGLPVMEALATEGRGMISPADPPALSLRGIAKTFGSHQALRGVDLDLRAGECLGLIGDNAAGKSTLSKVMSGTYIPDAGEILIEGQPVRFANPSDARARKIEMVYQDLALCDHVDVVGNLFLGRELRRGPFLDQRRMLAEAQRMLAALEIRIPRLTAKVEKLSGGQRQAIAIARAASFDPKVLIMDEPTSALAVAEVEAVLALINRVKARGVAVVLVTHRMQDLFRVCDRIAVMYEGTKVAERQTGDTNLQELVDLIVGKAGHP